MIFDVLHDFFSVMLRNTNLSTVDMKHVSAALDDGHKGDEDEGKQL